MHAVVGIDLGTSNSAVAVVGGDGPLVICDPAGAPSVPSVVAITQDDELLVGREAVQANAGPQNTFYSFKRLMGRKASNVVEEAARVFYTVTEGDQGEAVVYCPAADDLLRPEELSGWVIRHLAQQAQQHLREPVAGAVITVPAHFNQKQKAATLDAAAEAGLRQVHLLQEPVAAALAYGIGGGTDGETVLVFDVGGGTYDISVLQAFEGIMEVLGTAGDSHLGGDDFDAVIADWILEELSAGNDGAGSEAACSREWAAAAAEAAKVALSCSPQAVIDAPGGRQIVLPEAKFVELTAHLFRRLAAPLAALGRSLFIEWAVPPEQAAAAAPGLCSMRHPESVAAASSPGTGSDSSGSGSSSSSSSSSSRRGEIGQPSSGPADKWAPPPRRITKVALVGQVTRLPAMQRFVHSVTGVQPCVSVDPGEAVALGAAIQAGVLLGSVGSVELMDGSFVGELHERVSGFAEWQP